MFVAAEEQLNNHFALLDIGGAYQVVEALFEKIDGNWRSVQRKLKWHNLWGHECDSAIEILCETASQMQCCLCTFTGREDDSHAKTAV